MKLIKWDKRVNCYVLMVFILLTGCQKEVNIETEAGENSVMKEVHKEPVSLENKIILRIQETEIEVVLENNPTTKALLEKIPFTITMSDLNDNEKYVYLDEPLPANAKRVQRIKPGELMLFGSDCLVLFYEGHTTSYSYTKIGEVIDGGTIKDFLGKGKIEIEFVRVE